MRVGLAIEIDAAIRHLADVTREIDSYLRIYFLDKNYGADVENIFIGVILTEPRAEKLHPVRKLKYWKLHKIKIPGHVIETKNVVEYDVKPEYARISRLGLEQARQYIAQVLIDSTEILEQQKQKYPNFDVPKFRQEFKFSIARFAELG